MTKSKQSALIPSVSKKPKELTKIQKLFNTKSNKVKSLKEEINLVEAAIPIIKQRIHEELSPIRVEIAKNQAAIIILLDQAYHHKNINKNEKEKIKSFITNHTMVLIDRFKHENLIPIFNKYSEDSYEEIIAAGAKEGKKMAEQMFKNMGMDINFDDIDFTDIDAAMQEITEKFAEDIEEVKEKIANAEEEKEKNAKKRRKSPQELAHEKLKEQQSVAMAKTLKELYTQLVKEFHPDKELDIEKKAINTEIMKQITAAYESKDFFALLKLQLEYEQRDAKSFDDLPEEKLKHFIKILDDQIKDLKDELEMLKNPPMLPRDIEDIGEFLQEPKKIDINFKAHKRELIEMCEETKIQLRDFADIKKIKAFIKEYESDPEDIDIEEILRLFANMH
jgi:hypothetical protein